MKCNKCGQDIPDNATFCTNCGNKVEQPQQNVSPYAQQPNQVPNPNPQQVNQVPNQNVQQVNQTPNQNVQQVNQTPNQNPQQFNQMPNQNVPYGNQMPQQNVKTEPSPILKWLETSKDVFLSFFKKGYYEKPTTLLTEKNHMWLVFAVVAVIFGALKGLISAFDYYSVKLAYTINGFFDIGFMFFAFATTVFIVAKMAKNDKISYVNAMNGTAGAFLPVILATVANCIVTLVASGLAYNVEIASKIMFFVLFLTVVSKVVEGSKYQHSFWFKSLSILCPYLAYRIVVAIISAITFALSSVGDVADNISSIDASSILGGLSQYIG